MDVSGRWLSCLPQLPMNDFSVLVTKASGSIAFALFKTVVLKFKKVKKLYMPLNEHLLYALFPVRLY